MKVQNVVGSGSRAACRCGSWRKHWERYTLLDWPHYCSGTYCTNRAELGAHVVIIEPWKPGEHIIPLCFKCNGLTTSFDIGALTRTVSANRSETCDG